MIFLCVLAATGLAAVLRTCGSTKETLRHDTTSDQYQYPRAGSYLAFHSYSGVVQLRLFPSQKDSRSLSIAPLCLSSPHVSYLTIGSALFLRNNTNLSHLLEPLAYSTINIALLASTYGIKLKH